MKHLKNHDFIRQITLTIMALIGWMIPTTMSAQDLIAKQAPIDRKVKAIDSVIIGRALRRSRVVQGYEKTDLYTSWETDKVHCYQGVKLPDHYRIDLRDFHMPTPSRLITSNYGYRASFGRMHKGLDIKVYIGDTISSAFDGKVRVVSYEAKGYGKYVVIRHGNGLETIYGHLSKHLCKVGDVVKAGDPIGLGGNTGRSTGSHLHFETRLLGEALDPSLLFDFVAQDVTCDFYDYYSPEALSLGKRREVENGGDLARMESVPATTEPVNVTDMILEESLADDDESVTDKNNKRSKRQKSQSGKVYKVKRGDTLYSISRRVGLTVQQLCQRNGINQRSKLQLGQVIRY